MYKVYAKNGEIEYPLYEPLDETLRIFEPVLSEEMGSAGSFQFKIYRGHVNYQQIQPCASEIIIYDADEILFIGRVMKPARDMDNIVTITCEGIMTYLLDSIIRPVSISGGIQAYISYLLGIHNEQVEAKKRFYPGSIVVSGAGADTTREITEYTDVLTIIRQLVDTYGGYLRVRRVNGRNYLDYLWDYGTINDQSIRFGENLLDLSEQVDASQIITCLIPIGGEIEYVDDLGETQTMTVDIKSVNNGKDYIENTQAIEKYGRIWGVQQFDDITDATALRAKARAYLDESSVLPTTIELNAVDLSLIDEDINAFRVGAWTNIISDAHGIDQRFLLSKRELHLLDPTGGSITLGRVSGTMTGTVNKNQADISGRVDQIANSTSKEIDRKIENATGLITGGLGGYVVIDNIDPKTGKQMHPWRILIMNTPDKDTATNVIQINQNGIGFSTAGIDGPYRNAWTIDGNLVADFITAGTMLADRIRGGTLELGGKGLGRDGLLRVLDIDGNIIAYMDKSGITINNGKLASPVIQSGYADLGNGQFVADPDGVYIGGFYTFKTEWGDYLATEDADTGIGGSAFWSFWAGNRNGEGGARIDVTDPEQVLSAYGIAMSKEIIHCQELYLNHSIFQGRQKYWGVAETIDDLYGRIDSLQDQIDGIDFGGGDV